jgi:thiol-disulfide isomerase/thioredoxin
VYRVSQQKMIAGLMVVMMALGALAAGGCGSKLVTHIRNAEEFQERIVESKKPVLMDFYKGGCPTCVAIEPTMEQLAEEFGDRILFANFQIMTPWFGVTDKVMQKDYRVAYYPTVVLFVDGKEKKRWTVVLNEDQCRKELEALVGPPKLKEPKPEGEKPAKDKPEGEKAPTGSAAAVAH